MSYVTCGGKDVHALVALRCALVKLRLLEVPASSVPQPYPAYMQACSRKLIIPACREAVGSKSGWHRGASPL